MIRKQEVIEQISFLFAKAKSAEQFRDMITDYQLGLMESLKK